jgi:hypothetical protein
MHQDTRTPKFMMKLTDNQLEDDNEARHGTSRWRQMATKPPDNRHLARNHGAEKQVAEAQRGLQLMDAENKHA